MNHYGYYGMNYGLQNIAIIGVIFLLSLVGGIVLYFTFLNKKNEDRFEGFWGWLYDFLSFDKLIIDSLLKILYLIFACCLTLTGIFTMFTSFLAGLCVLVFGNVILRLSYELIMLLIIICKNTSSINKKMANEAENCDNAPSQPLVATPQPTFTPPVSETNPVICLACGTTALKDAAFCHNCGEKLQS